ncbi:MAG: hypothetical protein HRT54_18495 [Colwellia sp.]|nr:hypothetical protein [Colwellia sp.]
MDNRLKSISEVVAKASDLFSIKFDKVATLMGIMDKTLRNQGMNADAITLECISQKKKIVVLIHDDKPDVVEVALGNKQGHIYSSTEYGINELSVAVIVEIMETNFISQ